MKKSPNNDKFKPLPGTEGNAHLMLHLYKAIDNKAEGQKRFLVGAETLKDHLTVADPEALHRDLHDAQILLEGVHLRPLRLRVEETTDRMIIEEAAEMTVETTGETLAKMKDLKGEIAFVIT